MKKLSALLLVMLFAFASCDTTDTEPQITQQEETQYQQVPVDDVDPRSLEERQVR